MRSIGHTGRYSVERAPTVTIRRSGGLVLEAPGGNPAHLFPEDSALPDREGGQMTFLARGRDPSPGFTLHRNGDHPGVRLAEVE